LFYVTETRNMSAIRITVLGAQPAFAANICLAQSLLVNGDFQTGDLTGWTQFVTTHGTVGTPGVTLFDTSNTGNPSLSAEFQAGNLLANGAQEGGGIYQYFTLSSADNLQFSANAASFAAFPNGEGGQVSVFLDGMLFDNVSFGIMNGVSLTKYSLLSANLPNVSAGQHELEILFTRGVGAASYTPIQYVDNVSLSVVQVPEPSSWDLIILGAVICVIVARRKSLDPQKGEMTLGYTARSRQSHLLADAN
jgi:hypothetical protein